MLVQTLSPKATVSVPGVEPVKAAEPNRLETLLETLVAQVSGLREDIAAMPKPDDSAIRDLGTKLDTLNVAPLLREVIDGQQIIVNTLNQPVLPVVDEKTGRIKHAQRKPL